MLKRQARTQSVPVCPTSPSSSLSGRLNIIMEEDELRASSSTQNVGVKAKRRHANISNIRISANDFSTFDNTFLSPRPAPRPSSSTSTSPSSSPDSFKMTFNQVASKFPHPPTPSTADSASDMSSSPGHSAGMPLTPSTSDDEFSLPSPRFNPRRAAIQPLIINKHQLAASQKSTGEEYDSEPESDSEWYNREFSQLISMSSHIPTSFPVQHPSRPESMLMASPASFSHTRRRTSSFSRRSSVTSPSETAFPTKRNSKTRCFVVPKYPPPPPPVRSPLALPSAPRPPPRFSVPADCEFEVSMDDDEDAESEVSSAFSFSMYEVDFGERPAPAAVPTNERLCAIPESPASESVYSQPSFLVEEEQDEEEEAFPEDIHFELDYQLKLPLSIPGTPIDLETEVAVGLERLREREQEVIFEEAEFIVENGDDEVLEPALPTAASKDINTQFARRQEDYYTPSESGWSFSSSPSPSPSPSPYAHTTDEKMLKSKWSTSTLGSVYEDHATRRNASSKLNLKGYFNNKRTSSQSKKLPATPTSPAPSTFGLMTPKKTRGLHGHYVHSPSTSPSPPSRFAHTHKRAGSNQSSHSDVLVIGYGVNGLGQGLKRRGSVATVSDVGSEDSTSSTSSSGLKRKPIPVEMFLRGAA
ncbi:hypothetical protein CPB83DRAFT_855763 [Crepidotus variabilis]|uniref:Uncharacterized protein n=1 Tax=Crepidotus variabilis TaxID=179855 RepID=A0A9P6EEV6_9AGAR|nr:hypothetical protein CPB83DRAFT_855763 [Crepidotus variabilis]